MKEYNSKYPFVLVHGMMVKDFKLYRAFRKIRDKLIQNDDRVYVTNQDGIGTIENNAEQLKNEIKLILKKENVDKVNIIAHSKGGLDSRYMISILDMEDYVVSLTTLSTPHHGSKLSSFIMKTPNLLKKFFAFFINLFYRICGDKNPNIIKLGEQLKDTSMLEFNKRVINSNGVYYQSFSSNIDSNKSFINYLPYKISKWCENETTDGIVAKSSSI